MCGRSSNPGINILHFPQCSADHEILSPKLLQEKNGRWMILKASTEILRNA